MSSNDDDGKPNKPQRAAPAFSDAENFTKPDEEILAAIGRQVWAERDSDDEPRRANNDDERRDVNFAQRLETLSLRLEKERIALADNHARQNRRRHIPESDPVRDDHVARFRRPRIQP